MKVIAAFLGLVASVSMLVMLAVVHLGPHSVTVTVRQTEPGAGDSHGWLPKKDIENLLPTRTSVSVSPSVIFRVPAPTTCTSTTNPPLSLPSPPWRPEIELYALSLSYMDQISCAAARVKSLQCWATTWKPLYKHVGVVEPFVTGGARLGVPLDAGQSQALRFSDLFDVDTWDSEGNYKGIKYPRLVSWSDFLNYAPRNVVVVQIVYDYDFRCTESEFTEPTCGSARLNATFSQVFRPHNFTMMSQVCIDFKSLGVLSKEYFNRRIFDHVPEHTPVSVIFDEWRGPGDRWVKSNKCFIQISGGICTPNNKLTGYVKELSRIMLTPSLKINEQAKQYIAQYLHNTGEYVSVLIRWEKLLLAKFFHQHYWPSTGAKCVTKILDRVRSLSSQGNATFLTTDIGRFGSSTFNLRNATRDSIANVTTYTETLLGVFHNKSISLADYDQRFEDFAGTDNPAAIAQLQKTIAASGRCLVLVGWGTFHDNALKVYKRIHSRKKSCYKFIRSC